MRTDKQSIHWPSTYQNVLLWACVIYMMAVTGCRHRPVEPSPGIESPRQTWIRVLLFGNLGECRIASISGFEVKDIGSGNLAEFRSNESFQVRISDGVLVIGQHRFSGEVLIRPHEPYVFQIDKKAYRGYLRLSINETNQTFEAVNG